MDPEKNMNPSEVRITNLDDDIIDGGWTRKKTKADEIVSQIPIMLLLILFAMMAWCVLEASAQVPTTGALQQAPTSAAVEVKPEVYTRDKVARDTPTAFLTALNDPTPENITRAALSSLLEDLRKARVVTLIMSQRYQMLAEASFALGYDRPMPHLERVQRWVLETYGVTVDLPPVPPGFNAAGVPLKLGDLLQEGD